MAISPDHSDGCPDAPVRAPQPPAPSTGVPDWTADQAPDVRAPLTITAPADGSTASWARHEFNAWLAIDVPAGELFDDLVLAVYEALANAADHAYIDTDTGPVELLARRSRTALHVTVTDRGTWRTPASPTTAAPTIRGRGLPLIHVLVHDVHVELGPRGTTVHLRTPLPPPAEGPGGRQSSPQLQREGQVRPRITLRGAVLRLWRHCRRMTLAPKSVAVRPAPSMTRRSLPIHVQDVGRRRGGLLSRFAVKIGN